MFKTDSHKKSKVRLPHYLVLIFISLSVIIILLGIYYYFDQKERIIQQHENELRTISDYKSYQIEYWLKEREKHANSILKNKYRISEINTYLNNTSDKQNRESIYDWFQILASLYDYGKITLYDAKLKNQITVPQNEFAADIPDIEFMKNYSKREQVEISDLYQTDSASPIAISIFIPIFYDKVSEKKLNGYITFRIELQKFIFPLLASLPQQHKTMESLIAQKKDEQILFLSELKFKEQSALKFSIPLSEKDVLAVQASNGKTGITYGKDYRNNDVVGCISRIEGTSWYLITKIDLDEINLPIIQRTFLIVLFGFMGILIAGILIGLIWKNQTVKHYKVLYQKESETRIMEERYAILSKYANDIIILIDKDFNLIEANDRALEAYGYTSEEFLNLKADDLRVPEFSEGIKNAAEQLKESGRILIETEHRRKDGSRFPVEVSSRLIDIDGKIFYQNIIRDITERKKAEKTLKESEEKHRSIIEQGTILFYTHTPDHIITYISPQSRKFLDCDPEEAMVNWTNFATDNPVNELGFFLTQKAIDSGIAQPPYELELKSKTGRILWVEVNESPVVSNGKTISIIGSLTDITARKKAEERINKLNRTYRILSEINQAIVRTTNKNMLFVQICRILADIGSFRLVLAAEVNLKTGQVNLITKHGHDEGYADMIIKEKKEILFDTEPFKNAMLNGEILTINNIDKEYYKEWRKESVKRGFGSMCVIPIAGAVNDTKIAVILFSGEYDFFKKEEADLLSELGSDISFALNSIHLDQLRLEAEADLKKSKQHLQMLYETSEKLNRTLDLSNTYNAILDFVSMFMDCEGMIVTEYNAGENKFCCKAAWIQGVWSKTESVPATVLDPEEHRTLSQVIRTGKSLIVNDYEEELKKIKAKFRIEAEGKIHDIVPEKKDSAHSALMVPLIIEGKIIGVLHVFSFRKNAYSEEQKKILESIAVHISSSVNNATLYRLAREEISERKKTEEELRRSEERFSSAFKLSPIPTLLTRLKDGLIIDANEQFAGLIGVPLGEIIGKSTYDLKVEYGDFGREGMVKMLEEKGIIVDFEARVLSSKHGLRDTMSTLQLLKIQNEKCVLSMIMDVTEKKKSEEQLRKLSGAVNQSPACVIITDISGDIEYVNSKFSEISGYTYEEVIGKNPRILKSGETESEVYKQLWKTISSGKEWHGELRNRKKNGGFYWAWASISPIFDTSGKITNYLAVQEDITAQKVVQEQIQLQATLLQNIQDAVIYVDTDFRIRSWNEGARSIYGWKASEVIGKIMQEIIITDYGENLEEFTAQLRDTGSWKGEIIQHTKQGSKINVLSSISIVKNKQNNVIGVIIVNKDITERMLQEKKIKNSLKEKELLLKEIHHRVKNNLQVISSLLKIQASYIKDPSVLDYFRISSQRVKSMALIHEQLYRSADLSKIDFHNYVNKLASHLYQSYGINSNSVKININIKDIMLAIDTAIPCGLLVNELISNSLKHAFDPTQKGKIEIEMKHEDNIFNLIVRDNGKGFPDSIDFKNTETLGMQLINTLTEQLEGKIRLNKNNGTEFIITFKINRYRERI